MLPTAVKGKGVCGDSAGRPSGAATRLAQYAFVAILFAAVIFVVGLSRVPSPGPVHTIPDAVERRAIFFAAVRKRAPKPSVVVPPPARETNMTGEPPGLAQLCAGLPGRPSWVAYPRYDPSAGVVVRYVYFDDDDDDDDDVVVVETEKALSSQDDDDKGASGARGERLSAAAGSSMVADCARPAEGRPGGSLESVLRAMHAVRVPGSQRYDLRGMEKRVVPGSRGYFAVFNPGRGNNKRKAKSDTPTQVATPFDPEAFTFLRDGPQRELLFTFERARQVRNGSVPFPARGRCRAVAFCDRVDPRDADAAVYINVSPIDELHTVIIPRPREARPQVITSRAVDTAVRLRDELGSARYPVGFNGYGAWASVNHGHWQGYAIGPSLSRSGRFPVEHVPLAPAPHRSVGFSEAHAGVTVHALDGASDGGYPVPAIVYAVPRRDARSVAALAAAAAECASYLQATNVAHNALVSLGSSGIGNGNGKERGTDNNVVGGDGARVYIFPRRTGRHYDDDQDFHPGYPELAGHVIAKKREFYDTAVERDIDMRLAREALGKEDMERVWRNCA